MLKINLIVTFHSIYVYIYIKLYIIWLSLENATSSSDCEYFLTSVVCDIECINATLEYIKIFYTYLKALIQKGKTSTFIVYSRVHTGYSHALHYVFVHNFVCIPFDIVYICRYVCTMFRILFCCVVLVILYILLECFTLFIIFTFTYTLNSFMWKHGWIENHFMVIFYIISCQLL